jgi:DNA-directed RNA polymerase specialized sigma24 family protein
MPGGWVSRVGRRFASWIAGDAGAGEELWRLVRPRITAILRTKYRLSRGEAAEAAEEAFRELYLHRNTLRSGDGAWGYLVVTARRKALACISGKKSLILLSEEASSPSIPLESSTLEDEEKLDRFVDSLPFDLRRLALLIRRKEPKEEICRRLGISDRTLRRRIDELRRVAANFLENATNR